MKSPASSEFIPQILQSTAHRRFNPLTREWVLVSPHRTERPWQGQTEPRRPNQARPMIRIVICAPETFVREASAIRRTPAHSFSTMISRRCNLKPSAAKFDVEEKGIVVAQSESGICRVVCFSPRHDLTLSQMPRDGNPRLDRCLDRGISKFRAATRHQLCADF